MRIYKGNNKLGSGYFDSKSQGDSIRLFRDKEINSTTSTYKLYIWIDGNQENPSTMMNQDFVFHLNASVTAQEPVYEKMIEQPFEYGAEYDCYNKLDEYNENEDIYYYNILGKYINENIYNNLTRIYTLDSKTVSANAIESWDISENQNGSIMA